MDSNTAQALITVRAHLRVALDTIEGVKTLVEARGWSTQHEDAAIVAIMAAIEQHEKEAGRRAH